MDASQVTRNNSQPSFVTQGEGMVSLDAKPVRLPKCWFTPRELCSMPVSVAHRATEIQRVT